MNKLKVNEQVQITMPIMFVEPKEYWFNPETQKAMIPIRAYEDDQDPDNTPVDLMKMGIEQRAHLDMTEAEFFNQAVVESRLKTWLADQVKVAEAKIEIVKPSTETK